MRAFEAAARHVSFVQAAEELCVTPGAISQHVKTLEDWAGLPLFRRHAKGVEMTPEGRSLVATFGRAFDGLAEATSALRALQPQLDFHIAALPSIAQLWLPARLARIRAQFPSINFCVTALERPPNLARELFDLSVFFRQPKDSANRFEVGEDVLQPLCAGAVMARASGPDFGGLPLLHDLAWQTDWADWAASAGVALPVKKTGPQFSLYSLAVEEAKAGAGVLMGHLSLLEGLLHDGTFGPAHPTRTTTGRVLTVEIPAGALRRAESAQVASILAAD